MKWLCLNDLYPEIETPEWIGSTAAYRAQIEERAPGLFHVEVAGRIKHTLPTLAEAKDFAETFVRSCHGGRLRKPRR